MRAIDGSYVADGVVGDYLCARYGDLQKNPLSVTIENSRIVDVQCDRADLVADFRAYTSTDENSDRVGALFVLPNILQIKCFSRTRHLFCGTVGVNDQHVSLFGIRQRLEKRDDLGEFRRIGHGAG